jgi:zinc protease
VAKRLEVLAVYGLPDDYYDAYTERLVSATRDQLLEAARRHIDPERIAIVAVGPADELVPQFDGVGEVTVHRRPAASPD